MRTFKHGGKTVHDYRDKQLGWGWDLVKINWKVVKQKKEGIYSPGDEFEIQGIGKNLNERDQILIDFKNGIGCFDIDEIKYNQDPPDMWYAKLNFVAEVDMEGE